jgi:hypothetical protein
MVQAGRDRLARPRVRAHRAAAMEEGIRRTLAAR